MTSQTNSLRTKFLALLVLIPLFLLAACGSTSTTPSTPAVQLTVGSKKDLEAQLIAKLYSLLLTKAGFNVKEASPGTTPIVLAAIKNGDIDLYPEFTSTGLNALNINPTLDPQKDYQNVKSGFEKQFQITWLDVSPLNDTYALCTTKDRAQQLGITTISQALPKLSQLTLALPSDSLYVLDFLKTAYGIDQKSFKAIQKVDYAIGFDSVSNKQADLNFCYSTDVTISQKNFVVLQDDKNAFPAYNPAPIVRDKVLAANPKIKDALNPLAPLLTNEVSLSLQKQVLDQQAGGMSLTQAIKIVATNFLKSKGLL